MPGPRCLPHKRFSLYFILVLSYFFFLIFRLKALFERGHTWSFLSLLPAHVGRGVMLSGVI